MTEVSQSPSQLVPCSPFIIKDFHVNSPVPSLPNCSEVDSPYPNGSVRGVPCTPVTGRAPVAINPEASVALPGSGEQIVPAFNKPVTNWNKQTIAQTPTRHSCQQRRISNLNSGPSKPSSREIDLFHGDDIFD
ncbi:uncharacterized protein [Diadema setosum]|uniref:uncharacterized protein n=1 Tax=Diadema setosum TaxID=31175 RepID=UPI003B3A8D2B